jgi:hypothetical protein
VKTQLQMFYEEQAKIAARTASIMELVNHPTNPLTNQDLERAIARWPERYGMYAGFIGKLKDEDDHS